jgi:hypothetical protein
LPSLATTYNLTHEGNDEDNAVTGDLDVTATLTVAGRGSAPARLDGQAKDRVFDVHAGGKLILQQLTVRNGGNVGDGGGVQTAQGSTLELAQVTVADNDAVVFGGGIHSEGALVIRSATISGNDGIDSGSSGGGLYHSGGSALLESVTFTDNHAGDDGGGCYLSLRQVRLRNVTLASNTADREGGGCFILNTAEVAFEGGRIERNESGQGGGLGNRATLRLTGTTITRNTATASVGGGSTTLAP